MNTLLFADAEDFVDAGGVVGGVGHGWWVGVGVMGEWFIIINRNDEGR